MKTFDNRNNDSKGKNFRRDSGKNRFGNKDRERSQMHEAVCSDCGKRCEVPFKPTNDKPVYCSQCFTEHGGGANSGNFEKRSFDKPRFSERRMYDSICDKCGKRFELPFKPTGDKEVFCNDCFDRGSNSGNRSDRGSNQNKEQFDMMNAKLDKIISILASTVPAKKEDVVKKEIPAKKEIKEIKPEKVVTIKAVVKKAEKKKAEKVKKPVKAKTAKAPAKKKKAKK